LRPNRKDGTIGLTEETLRNGPEEQLRKSASSVTANDEQINKLFSDQILQFGPDFPSPYHELVFNAVECPGPKKTISQLGGVSRDCLFTGGNCAWACQGKTQRRNYVR
jgi:hypothetical protein